MSFCPEPKRVSWWSRLRWRMHFFHPIRFEEVTMPFVSVSLPPLQLNDLAKVQLMGRSVVQVFYIDPPRFAVRRMKSFWEFW